MFLLFYNIAILLVVMTVARLACQLMHVLIFDVPLSGVPHTLAKLAICYCILHFGY